MGRYAIYVASALLLGIVFLLGPTITAAPALAAQCECCKGDKTKRWSGDYIGMRDEARCNALRDGACRGTDLAKFMCDPYKGAKCCIIDRGAQSEGVINSRGFCEPKIGQASPNFTNPPCL